MFVFNFYCYKFVNNKYKDYYDKTGFPVPKNPKIKAPMQLRMAMIRNAKVQILEVESMAPTIGGPTIPDIEEAVFTIPWRIPA
jgi:hypothetical protein